jgi:hypothetical protein
MSRRGISALLAARVARAAPAILLAIVLVGCGGQDKGGDSQATGGDAAGGSLSSEVVVARDNPALPKGCRPLHIGTLALRFSDALNRGDEETLARIWSGPFEWFSITAEPGARSVGPLVRPERDRRHFVAYSPDGALRYVEQPRGFEMHLTELAINGRASYGGVDVFYGGVWHEPDDGQMRRYWLGGKGFVNCGGRPDRQSIRVWSMAVKGQAGFLSRACPNATDARRRLVVCWLPE